MVCFPVCIPEQVYKVRAYLLNFYVHAPLYAPKNYAIVEIHNTDTAYLNLFQKAFFSRVSKDRNAHNIKASVLLKKLSFSLLTSDPKGKVRLLLTCEQAFRAYPKATKQYYCCLLSCTRLP